MGCLADLQKDLDGSYDRVFGLSLLSDLLSRFDPVDSTLIYL
jgi:hypothetical protein